MNKPSMRFFLAMLAVVIVAIAATHSARAACDTIDPGNPPGEFE